MKKPVQKLELNRETLRTLDVRKLAEVAGGYPTEANTVDDIRVLRQGTTK
jgi:hypothetical protein